MLLAPVTVKSQILGLFSLFISSFKCGYHQLCAGVAGHFAANHLPGVWIKNHIKIEPVSIDLETGYR